MASYIGSKERRIIYQSMAFMLGLGATFAEAGDTAALGLLKSEKKDQAEAARALGKAIEAFQKSAMEKPAEAPDASKDNPPLLDLVEKALNFQIAASGAGSRLSASECVAFAIPQRLINLWITDKSFAVQIAKVFTNAAEAAGDIKGTI